MEWFKNLFKKENTSLYETFISINDIVDMRNFLKKNIPDYEFRIINDECDNVIGLCASLSTGFTFVLNVRDKFNSLTVGFYTGEELKKFILDNYLKKLLREDKLNNLLNE